RKRVTGCGLRALARSSLVRGAGRFCDSDRSRIPDSGRPAGCDRRCGDAGQTNPCRSRACKGDPSGNHWNRGVAAAGQRAVRSGSRGPGAFRPPRAAAALAGCMVALARLLTLLSIRHRTGNDVVQMESGVSDEAYQDHILPHVSRTFALTIPQLPPALRTPVTTAY